MPEIDAQAGQEFTITLEATPGGGAVWRPVAIPAGLTLLREDRAAAGDGVGGPVRQSFVFRAERAGEFDLAFELKRAWEAAVRAQASYIVRAR